jgi:hypothetical protein
MVHPSALESEEAGELILLAHLFFILPSVKHFKWLDVEADNCNPITWETEA